MSWFRRGAGAAEPVAACWRCVPGASGSMCGEHSAEVTRIAREQSRPTWPYDGAPLDPWLRPGVAHDDAWAGQPAGMELDGGAAGYPMGNSREEMRGLLLRQDPRS